MSITEKMTDAVSTIPSASTLDEGAVKDIVRAVLTELAKPTQYMIVHADDHTLPDGIEENRVKWYQRMIEAALIELADENQRLAKA